MNSAANLLQLQQQAAARVRETEERSRRLVREHPINVYRGVTLAPMLERQPPPAPVPPAAEPFAPPPCTNPAPPCVTPAPPRRDGLLALFGGDNERLLLLLIAAVLVKNSAPLELILALLYVAL